MPSSTSLTPTITTLLLMSMSSIFWGGKNNKKTPLNFLLNVQTKVGVLQWWTEELCIHTLSPAKLPSKL